MMKVIRVKFIVTEVAKRTGSRKEADRRIPFELATVTMIPVSDVGEDEQVVGGVNSSGPITLGITNPAAWNAFEVGEEYYLEFTKVGEEVIR